MSDTDKLCKIVHAQLVLTSMLEHADGQEQFDQLVEGFVHALHEGKAKYQSKFPAPIGRIYTGGDLPKAKDNPFGLPMWRDFSAIEFDAEGLSYTLHGVTTRVLLEDMGEVHIQMRGRNQTIPGPK